MIPGKKKKHPNVSLTGFTLIELLVAMAIIGILVTIGSSAINYARNQAREAKAKNDIDEIYKAITMLATDGNLWPGSQPVDRANVTSGNEICGDGCTFGLSSNRAGLLATDGSYDNWSGPYIGAIPNDPWGHQYFFDTDYRILISTSAPCNGALIGCMDAAVVGSYGPDGVGNGSYNADDIIKIIAK
jgi:prepilin-type N-terminal cleavage/methylation domain-containing protein